MKEITITKNILNENSDVLKDFFKDIDKYPIYSGETQVELAREALAGNDKSREKLITSNLRFVVTCAKKYTGQGVPLVDLIQAGLMGLCMAVDNYDPDKGYKFLSFAVWYIRREILKEIYNTGRTIRYPITYIGKITKVKKAYEKFLGENQREPTDDELIELANITQRQYDSVVLDKSYCQSIDTPLTDDGNTTLEDILPETSDSFSDVFTKDAISKALKCLNSREYKVITEFYGLEGEYERPIKDIAKEQSVSEFNVKQRLYRIRNKIRKEVNKNG